MAQLQTAIAALVAALVCAYRCRHCPETLREAETLAAAALRDIWSIIHRLED